MSMLRENGMRALLMRWSSEGKPERLLLVFFFFFLFGGGGGGGGHGWDGPMG